LPESATTASTVYFENVWAGKEVIGTMLWQFCGVLVGTANAGLKASVFSTFEWNGVPVRIRRRQDKFSMD
jgi:hypothetical protein